MAFQTGFGLIKPLRPRAAFADRDKLLIGLGGPGTELPLINVDVYYHEAHFPVSSARKLGTFKLNEPIYFKLALDQDTDVAIRTIGRNSRGLTTVSSIEEAEPSIKIVKGLASGNGSGTGKALENQHIALLPNRAILNSELPFIQFADEGDALARSQIKPRRIPTGSQNVITDWNASGDGRVYKANVTAGSHIIQIRPGESFDLDAGVIDLHPVPYYSEAVVPHSFRGGQGVRIGVGTGLWFYSTITAVNGAAITLADAVPITFAGVPFIHDDTAAIIAAFNNRGHLWIPEGRYWINRRLLWPATSTGKNRQIILEGDGEWRSVFMFHHDGNGIQLLGDQQAGDLNSGVYDAIIRNLGIWCIPDDNKEGLRPSNKGHGLAFTATSSNSGVPGPSTGNVRVENVLLQGWGRWGLWSDNLQSAFLTNIKAYHNLSGAIALVGNATSRGTSQQEDNSIEIVNSLVVYSGPKDFGLAGNAGRTIGGGSIAAWSRLLNVGGGGLTSEDIGCIIKLVDGPGVNSSTHVTMIESVQSSTQCTISMPVWQSAGTGIESDPRPDFNVIIYPKSVANIFLHSANNVRISGGTHQGNWVEYSGDASGVRAENLDALRIDGLWEEDAGGTAGAAIDLYSVRAVSIDSTHTGGSIDVDPPITVAGHGVGIRMTDVQGVKVRGTYIGQSGAGTAYATHGNCQGVEFDNCYGADWIAGLANTDVAGEPIIIGPGSHSLSFDNVQTNTLQLWDERWTNIVGNPNFLEGMAGWTTPIAGVVTQPNYPYVFLPARWERYVVINTQALGSGQVDVLTQDIPLPDSRQSGQWTFSWDHYIESRGAGGSTDNNTVVTIEVRTATAGYTVRSVTLTADVGYGLPVGRWMRLCIKTNLDGGVTGRFFRIRFSNAGTGNSPIFRVGNMRLQPGISGTFDFDQPITQERGGPLYAPLYFKKLNPAQFPPPPPPVDAISIVNIDNVLKMGMGGVYATIGGGGIGPGTPNKLAMFGPTPGTTVVDGPAIATPSELVILGVGLRVENAKALDTLYTTTNYCQLAICGADDIIRFGPTNASNGMPDGSVVLFQAGGGIGPTGQLWNNGATGCLTYNADRLDNSSVKSWGPSAFHLATYDITPAQHGLTIHAVQNTGYTGNFIQCLLGNLHLTQFAVADDGNLAVIRHKAYEWPTGTFPPTDTTHPVKFLGYTSPGPPVVLSWLDPPGGTSSGVIISGTAHRVAKFNPTGDNVTNSAIEDRTFIGGDGFIAMTMSGGLLMQRAAADTIDLSPDLYMRTGLANDAVWRYRRGSAVLPGNEADGEMQLFLHANVDTTHANAPFVAFGTVHSWFQTTLRIRPYFYGTAGNSIEVWSPTTSIPYFAVAQDGNLAIIRQVIYAWPFDHPTAPATQKFLRCDASGNLFWDTPTSSIGSVSSTAGGTHNKVPRWQQVPTPAPPGIPFTPTWMLVDSAIDDRTGPGGNGTLEFDCVQLLFKRIDATDISDFYMRSGANNNAIFRYEHRAWSGDPAAGVEDSVNTEGELHICFVTGAGVGGFGTPNVTLGSHRSFFHAGLRIRPTSANFSMVGSALEVAPYNSATPNFAISQAGDLSIIKGVPYQWPGSMFVTTPVRFLQCSQLSGTGILSWVEIPAGTGTVGPGTINTMAMFMPDSLTVKNSQINQDAAKVYVNDRDLVVIGDSAVADLAQLWLQPRSSLAYGVWRFEHRTIGLYDPLNTAGEMQLRVNADVTHIALGSKRAYFNGVGLRVRMPDTTDFPLCVNTIGGALTSYAFRVDTDGGLGIIRSVNYVWPTGYTNPVGGTAYKFLGFKNTSGSPVLEWADAPGGVGGGANTALSNLTTTAVNLNINPDATLSGTINLGDNNAPGGPRLFGVMHCKNGVFVFPSGSTETGSPGPRAFGFIPSATPFSTGEATRFLIYGDRNCFQSGDHARTQICSYVGIELQGNRRDVNPPSFNRLLNATSEDTAVVISSPNNSIGLFVNLPSGNTRDMYQGSVGGSMWFRVTASGDLTIHGVSYLFPASLTGVTNGMVLSISNTGTGQLAWIAGATGGGVTQAGAAPLTNYLTKWTPGSAPYTIQNSSIQDVGIQVTCNNPFKVAISGTDKFKINNQGSIDAEGGAQFRTRTITGIAGGSTTAISTDWRTVIIDTFAGPQNLTLPSATANPGMIIEIIHLRAVQSILTPIQTGYDQLVQVMTTSGDVFNGWGGGQPQATVFKLAYPGTNGIPNPDNQHKIIRVVADESLAIWWLMPYYL